jgi:hypothetical protein
MIRSAQEFVTLRTSQNPVDYLRAATESAPIQVWWQVIRDFPSMRTWVVHNKKVPMEILNSLARDSNGEVRFAVAMKNKLSEELMGLLAGDLDETVRERIAYNKKTPHQILEHLSHDPCERVSQIARTRLEKLTRKSLNR